MKPAHRTVRPLVRRAIEAALYWLVLTWAANHYGAFAGLLLPIRWLAIPWLGVGVWQWMRPRHREDRRQEERRHEQRRGSTSEMP